MTVLGPGRVPVIALLAAQICGCGMKGPPQAPFVRVPAAVGELVVQRLGDEVSIGFTLPTTNEDQSEPASLARVDVYAMTTQPRLTPERTLELEEYMEAATLVASFDVAPPPDPEDTEPEGEAEGGTVLSEEAAAGTSPAGAETAGPPLEQGDPVLLTEALTAEAEVPVDPWEEERRRREEEAEAARAEEDDTEEPERPVMVPLMTPPLPGPLQREYVVVQVSEAGDESEGGERIAVPLGIRVPAPPPAPEVVYSEATADVTWELPPGVRETVQGPATAEEAEGPDAEEAEGPDAEEAGPDAAGGDEANAALDEAVGEGEAEEPAGPPPPLESRPIVEWPPASTYEVFEVAETEDGSPAVPARLGETPLEAPSYSEPRGEYGAERCYAVRTLDVVAGFQVRSRLSPVTCVTFVDTFAPAAPEALTAIGSAGEVSLLWRPNDEDDLAGYVVLRGLPGDETLQPLTDAPLVGNTYRDVSAEPGVRHVYAVRAVDDAAAPNLSEPSEHVEAAAR